MLNLYFLAAILGLVWGAVLLRWGGLLAGCLAILVLGCCFGFDFYSFRAGPLPLTTDRLAVIVLGLVYLAGRLQGWVRSQPLDLVDFVFCVFLVTLTVNTLTHDWRFRNNQPLANLLFLYGLPAVVYWFARDANVGPGRIQLLFAFLGIFSIYLAVTAVAETKQLHSLVFPSYILNSSNHEWLGRGRGPFLNPATNGIYLATGLFAWLMFWPNANRIGRVGVLAAAGVVLVGIYCTLTRSCWIGAAAGVGLVVFVSMPRHFRLPLITGCLLLMSLVYVAKGDSFASFKRDKNVSEFHMAESARLRPLLARVAMNIAWDHPLFGCGFGQYKRVDRGYVFDRSYDMPLEVAKNYVQHNLLLSLLTETGGVGLGLFLLVLAGWLHRAWRVWTDDRLPPAVRRQGLLFGAFFVNWFVNSQFHDTSLMMNANLLTFLLAGVTQGIYARANPVLDVVAPTDATLKSWSDNWLERELTTT